MVARKIFYYAISKKEYDELDDSGILDFGEIHLTDETDIDALRKILMLYII
ncbi:hypothetical protein [Candidatus Stoquefichus massiliensis]|uniref:hypothetical protein n=1 Tax=Candidatus Stoquefichus massiliensis TaxID=1470350 RepID=UPI0004B7DC21|nr:hypothetical protein [Candidatus Stoquefichus massiliensis]